MAFEKGQSGNPGGRPKENAEVKALARTHGPRAIERLAEIMNSADERAAAAASNALLDRGYGKPAQAIVGGSDEDDPVKLVIKGAITLVKPKADEQGGE